MLREFGGGEKLHLTYFKYIDLNTLTYNIKGYNGIKPSIIKISLIPFLDQENFPPVPSFELNTALDWIPNITKYFTNPILCVLMLISLLNLV